MSEDKSTQDQTYLAEVERLIHDAIDAAYERGHAIGNGNTDEVIIAAEKLVDAGEQAAIDAVRALVTPSKNVRKLIEVYGDTTFACGECSSDDYTSYRVLSEASSVARAALYAQIAILEHRADKVERVSDELRHASEAATPGPWTLDIGPDTVVRGEGLKIVAVRNRLPKPEHDANARLIMLAVNDARNRLAAEEARQPEEHIDE